MNTKIDTFVDYNVRAKAHVPAPNVYELSGSMVRKSKCTRQDGLFPKEFRETMPCSIEKFQQKNKYPAPNSFTPTY